MKYLHSLYLIFTTAVLCSVTSACELESSDNGKLDGMWKLTSVDTLATGGSTSMMERQIFWSVQSRVLQMNEYIHQERCIFRFKQTADSLILWDARYNQRELGDPAVASVNDLPHLYLPSLTPRYRKELLSSSSLVLTDGRLRLIFSKW